ncbi:MAG: hypothetical protein M1608_05880 [Candidatus Omnitrophica bacterium]|nr:hypothetical protein [Candidatus Omnitrophota bacterium]
MATSKQVSNGTDPQSDWNQGYGFQFWRCRHNAFRGDGAFGQYCLVMPDQDAVVAITSGVKDMQAVLNVIWAKLLPAFQSEALPANPAALDRLKEYLVRLEVRPAQGAATSPLSGSVINRKFVFPANDQQFESLEIASSDSGKTLTLEARIGGKDMMVPCGYLKWEKGRAPLLGGPLAQFPDEPTAGTFAWPTDDTCMIQLCACETPFQTTLALKFDGDQVTLDSEANVAFGPTKKPRLIGRVDQVAGTKV